MQIKKYYGLDDIKEGYFGVYSLWTKEKVLWTDMDKCLYVGKGKIRARIYQHLRDERFRGLIKYICVYPTSTDREAALLEYALIQALNPSANIQRTWNRLMGKHRKWGAIIDPLGYSFNKQQHHRDIREVISEFQEKDRT
ncbi:hypothetical protein P4640_27245 [Priestia aryabhattai]|uniref:hypothetical protein n=1 Tax=Priestia aryabhattai TaxID=412384 RepID=UPI002E1D5447|nr:hypothetical protein [Priestia aryabhattai]